MSHDLAQEEEEFDEWDSSDGDEAKKCANADAPSEYALPFVNSSHGFDRVIQREEETIHLREIVNARSSRVFPTVIPVSSARDEPLPSRIKPRRRSASVPPPAVAKMTTTELRRSGSTPPLGTVTRMNSVMSSSDMEVSHSTGIAVDVAGSEEEQDWRMEDEVELKKRLLKQRIRKYMGAEELVAPGFKFFHVRCQHLVIDPLILQAGFPYVLPGDIYLQARSMLPLNTVLAAYLLTMTGLLYSKALRFAFPLQTSKHHISTAEARTDLTLPILGPMDDPVGIQCILRESSHLGRYPPRRWIKYKRGLHKDEVGLFVADEFDEISSDVERLVLFPPRIDWDLVPDFSSEKASLGKRKREPTERPAVLSRKAGVYIDQNYCFPTRMDCAEHCETPHSCSHSEATHKRYICLGQQWQNGLVLVRIKLADMELASEIPADIRYYFLESKHYAVQQSLLRMPPPSSWDFQIGEDVRFTDLDGVWCTPGGRYTFELPEGCTKGVIHHVGPSDCEISIPLQVANITVNPLHTMLKVHLVKIFFPGDIVQLPLGDRTRLRLHHETNEHGVKAETEDIELARNEGLVISVCSGGVEVLLQEGHNEKQICESHPNTHTKVEQSAAVHDVLSHRPKHLSAHQRRLPLIDSSTAQFPLQLVTRTQDRLLRQRPVLSTHPVRSDPSPTCVRRRSTAGTIRFEVYKRRMKTHKAVNPSLPPSFIVLFVQRVSRPPANLLDFSVVSTVNIISSNRPLNMDYPQIVQQSLQAMLASNPQLILQFLQQSSPPASGSSGPQLSVSPQPSAPTQTTPNSSSIEGSSVSSSVSASTTLPAPTASQTSPASAASQTIPAFTPAPLPSISTPASSLHSQPAPPITNYLSPLNMLASVRASGSNSGHPHPSFAPPRACSSDVNEQPRKEEEEERLGRKPPRLVGGASTFKVEDTIATASDGTEVVSLVVLVYPPPLTPDECQIHNIPLRLHHYVQNSDAFQTVLESLNLVYHFDNLSLNTKVVDLLDVIQSSLSQSAIRSSNVSLSVNLFEKGLGSDNTVHTHHCISKRIYGIFRSDSDALVDEGYRALNETEIEFGCRRDADEDSAEMRVVAQMLTMDPLSSSSISKPPMPPVIQGSSEGPDTGPLKILWDTTWVPPDVTELFSVVDRSPMFKYVSERYHQLFDMEEPGFMIKGENTHELARIYAKLVRKANIDGDFTTLLSEHRHFQLVHIELSGVETYITSGPGVEKEVMSIFFQSAFNDAPILLTHVTDDFTTLATVPMSSASEISTTKKDELTYFGSVVGLALIHGIYPVNLNPLLLVYLLNDCDLSSITKDLVLEFFPTLYQTLIRWLALDYAITTLYPRLKRTCNLS
ncbi:hypothetical protein C8R42DRAFT_723590 [Lentinula raphanica]|nr:hypothetical protein C8R42DRAFT_723590 [Lentinula raphanica]